MQEECVVVPRVACACVRMLPLPYTPERLFVKFIVPQATARHTGCHCHITGMLDSFVTGVHHAYMRLFCLLK